MDATIQGLRLPEGFAGMLEDNGLPLPPLPLEAINELEQTDEWFFATDGREPLSGLAGLYLEDLDAVFDSPEAPQGLREGPVRYLGCGLLGGGLQSWQFRYLLDAGRLRLGLSLPWGGAWNDPETERLSLEAACSFIEACQACLPQSGVLNVVLDAERCAWRLDTPEGDVQQQGEGLYALLDKDATYSESERRKLKTRPKLTFSAMLDGSYASDYRDYFADTFPNREKLMNANRSLNGFYYFSGGSKDGAQLVINMNGGAANHGEALNGNLQFASASALRALWTQQGVEALRPYVPEAVFPLYQEAAAAGSSTDFSAAGRCELALLRARCTGETPFAKVRGVSEGLEHRLEKAVRASTTLDELLNTLTTIRYPRARMRRLAMDAALGYTEEAFPALPPYLHLLGARRELLGQLKQAALPVSHSLMRLQEENAACAQMVQAQLTASDFAAFCRAKPRPMGGALRQKIIFLTI